MQNSEQNNKRIAKNTLALYFRQMIVMGVSLFTYRVVLQTLGVIDFGINNVVGGIVWMFGFLSGTLMNITQRFINVEMEKGDNNSLQKVFATSLMLHIAMGLIIIILGETAGLWFLENKLVIPAERMPAARYVYQFALLGFLLSKVNAPFMALVIAHEDMHIYGYVGIFEVVMRLITAYLLVIINADKLIIWAMFGFFATGILTLFYYIYCRKKYQEAKFSFYFDKSLIKELAGYGGYVFIHSTLVIFRGQGVNVILNMFFGPAVNAARGLAAQVDNALSSFGLNIRQALNPQLTKSCARNDKQYMWDLLERGTRVSYFLILIFAIPLILQMKFILNLWLKNVPEYTAIFTVLLIMSALMEIIIANFFTIINASGKLKEFYIIHYIYIVSILVLSYVICKLGYSPQYVFIIPLPMFLLSMPARFIVMKKQVGFSFVFFAKKALLPALWVSVISFVPFYFINKITPESFFYSCGIIISSILWSGMAIMYFGLRKNERIMIFNFVKYKILRR